MNWTLRSEGSKEGSIMVTKKVIKNIEAAINRICEDIKDK
jgi:hypothetical protein